MSFHEKSAWACLLAICGVYIPYFLVVFRFPMAALGLFWIAVIGMVAVLTLFHVVNAIATRFLPESRMLLPVDELDRSIELQAAKWSGIVLACAVISWVLIAMYVMPVIGAQALEQAQVPPGELSRSTFTISVFTAMAAVHWLFAGFVCANIAYYGGIVIGYWRFARE